MQRALTSISARGGIDLWFPAPSGYEALDFLSAIADQVAAKVATRMKAPTQPLRNIYALLLFVALTTTSISFFFNPVPGATPEQDAVAAAIAASLLLAAFLLLELRYRLNVRTLDGHAALLASRLRERVRFATNVSKSSETSASFGRSFSAGLKQSHQRSLVERPLTVAALVQDFRELARSVVCAGPRVAIGIDELDKVNDTERVRSLLREVKAIFEVPGVYYFVSISDEAAHNFDMGAVGVRDEFHSSFYTVINLKPMSVEDCTGLLQLRKVVLDLDVLTGLSVISGGNPRELVRLAERVVAMLDTPDLALALATCLRSESEALQRECAETPGLDPQIVGGAYKALELRSFASSKDFESLLRSLFDTKQWHGPWRAAELLGASPGKPILSDVESIRLGELLTPWEQRLREKWQRLLVRLAISALLLRLGPAPDTPGDAPISRGDSDRLQVVASTATQSAAAARAMLLSQIQAPLTSDTQQESFARTALLDWTAAERKRTSPQGTVAIAAVSSP